MNKAILSRYKASVPFSQRLNDWLVNWAQDKKIIHTESDDFDASDIEGTFQRHRSRYLQTGEIHVWTGQSDLTIYGDPEINWIARAWHDATHYDCNLSYSTFDEIKVGIIQMKELPPEGHFEKLLVHHDVIGQIMYHSEHGHFPLNQRVFTLNQL